MLCDERINVSYGKYLMDVCLEPDLGAEPRKLATILREQEKQEKDTSQIASKTARATATPDVTATAAATRGNQRGRCKAAEPNTQSM
jgi:hypothetical protein